MTAGPRTSGLDRPIFVVGPPECGGSLVAAVVASASGCSTADVDVRDGVGAFDPAQRGWDSDRLRSGDAQVPHVDALDQHLRHHLAAAEEALEDEGGPSPARPPRLVVSLPRGSLQVSFLAAAYPDARFVVVHREPQESLAGMLDAWRSQRSVAHPSLPGWPGPSWSLLLTPQWRTSVGRPLEEVVAQQWRSATEVLLADLGRLQPGRHLTVDLHAIVDDAPGQRQRLLDFLEIEHDAADPGRPAAAGAVASLGPSAWPEHEAELAAVVPGTAALAERLRDTLDRPAPAGETPATSTAGGPDADAARLRSRSTSNFGPVLRQLGSSLLVSTYQSGLLVFLRELEGTLNTHFRPADAPMGVAFDRGRIVVGTRTAVREYRNVPAVIERLETPEPHDACFLPSRVDHTGDIRVHDVGWVDGDAWFVATRFSCLATLDGTHSFVPRWKPPFITDLQAEDRCHLNGMAIQDGRVRWVTALGVTDEAGGWRARKADGGVIIDVTTDDLVVEGLCMPHSPRWYRDRLWVLESGQGSLGVVDLDTGTVETVVELPGFTRGLAFAGPLAFVGLSEVREAATFGGLPLTGRLEERECGVWVVNIETGTVIAKLRFEGTVEEIFDVCLLPGIAFPELLDADSTLAASTFVLPPPAAATG